MTVEETNAIEVEQRGQVLLVTLSRPGALNALDVEMMSELRALWRALPNGVRCVVITGAGSAFCAGADMSLLESDRDDAAASAVDELSFLPGEQIEVPMIAAVNGVCAGGGLHFVADADIAIAAAEASFVDPHVSVGQVTALEPLTLRLRMRSDVLTRMVLLGRAEKLSAERALAAGLVSEVLSGPDLLPRALELADRIAQNSPAAVRRSRAVIRAFERDLLERHLEDGWSQIRAHWEHPDAKEGPAAFLARRPPEWSEE
jgi:enoyl-CoA hydratase/carnithine racemase